MKAVQTKLLIRALILITAFIAVERFCHQRTHGFRPHKIAVNLLREEKLLSSAEPEKDIRAALEEPYYFLGSGGQSYAFISADGNYVIKFFKQHHMRIPSWINKVPLPALFEPMRSDLCKQRLDRRKTFFTSCILAYERLREQTGLLYLHLNQTTYFPKKLVIHDNIGIAHQIDLDQTQFALQKRADMAFPTLASTIKCGKIEEAKEQIDSLLNLILSRCEAGVADGDPIIKRNMAFIGNRAVEIDLGSYFLDESLQDPVAARRVLFFETLKLRRWVKKRHPNLEGFLDQRLKELLEIEPQR